ncbi:MAG: response regulator [Anaerolineae bacterium]|nr:response regulator [Anaerolineae bacterium]
MDKYHILLAEDDKALLRGVTDLLEMSGYQVYAASDGRSALRLLEQLSIPPDLIISDIAMPYMDGYKFLNAVRARPEWVSIPFIFLTARAEKEDIRTGKLRGVDDYVTKPFELPDLLVAVQSTLSRRRRLSILQEQEMENLRQQILKILNHEFRTPLTYIVAYAELMAASSTSAQSEELRQCIDGIQHGSERLSRLIESLLLLAEMESGNGRKIFDQRKTVISDLGSLVREVVAQLQTTASERGLTLHVASDGFLPSVIGDPEYLRVALANLLGNAIKFSPVGSKANVSVLMEVRDAEISVLICDEGAGIPPEGSKHLFQPFYQHNRDKDEQQGIGAGLAIARHIASFHGGRIERLNRPGGGGSCFVLTLPVYRQS